MTPRPALGMTALSIVSGALLGGGVGLAVAIMRRVHAAPLVAVGAVLFGILLPLIVSGIHVDLRIARLGSLAEKRSRAWQRKGAFVIASTRAAVAVEAGELDTAEALLGKLPALDGQVRLVRARYELARGDTAALDTLLAWKPSEMQGSAFIGELRRYHAYVVAKALAGMPDDERRRRAAEKLLAQPDPEVRAYGAWLVALDGEEHPALFTSDELARAAALARHEGLVEIGLALETQAAKLATLVRRSGPYRG